MTLVRHRQYFDEAPHVGISVLTVEEQLSGWYTELRRVKKPAALAAVYKRMAKTVGFYANLPIWTFDEPAIVRYEELKRLKLGIGKIDLRIAAIALERNAIVVTRNKMIGHPGGKSSSAPLGL